MRKPLAVVVLVVVLVLVNLAIWYKEQQLAHGRVVLLELAPVDPRSLMQGDYMALRFAMENAIYTALPKQNDEQWRPEVAAGDGKVIVRLDEHSVAHFVARDEGQTLETNQLRLRYRIRHGDVKFATNAFFFQEGHAEFYENARYGAFRVDDDGELLLTDLHDEQYRRIVPPSEMQAAE